MRKVRLTASFILGLVFFVSGTLKLMDPVGTALTVKEYFAFFHLGFLSPAATAAGFALSLLEALTGAALATRILPKTAAVCASALTVIFTLVTLCLWAGGAVMDCGCFGQAIPMSPAESFLKNIVLCALCGLAFLPRAEKKKPSTAAFWIVALSSAGLGIYCLLFIPPLDFTPFDLSSRLYEAARHDMDIEEEYVSVFIYEKDGQQGTFSLDKLPDSTWTFVDSRTQLRQNHLHPDNYPVLSITDANGEICDSIAVGRAVMAYSVYKPESLDGASWAKIENNMRMAAEKGFRPILLVASTPEALKAAAPDSVLPTAYFADYKTLISFNRSNGGAVYLHNGYLIEKWPLRRLPSERRFRSLARSHSTEISISASTKGKQLFYGYFLYGLAVLALL